MKAILMVSHGSRHEKTLNEVRDLARDLKLKIDVPIFEYAFLELESPGIAAGLDLCVRQGARDILVLLNFLNAGQHVDYDIPEILEEARQRHSGVKIRMSRPVGQHPWIREVFLQIIQATLTTPPKFPPKRKIVKKSGNVKNFRKSKHVKRSS